MYKLLAGFGKMEINRYNTLEDAIAGIEYYGLADSTGDPVNRSDFLNYDIVVTDSINTWLYDKETRSLIQK